MTLHAGTILANIKNWWPQGKPVLITITRPRLYVGVVWAFDLLAGPAAQYEGHRGGAVGPGQGSRPARGTGAWVRGCVECVERLGLR